MPQVPAIFRRGRAVAPASRCCRAIRHLLARAESKFPRRTRAGPLDGGESWRGLSRGFQGGMGTPGEVRETQAARVGGALVAHGTRERSIEGEAGLRAARS